MNILTFAKDISLKALDLTVALIIIPILVALIMVPFFGAASLVLVAITYSHLIAWPFGVLNDFGDQVAYDKTLERSSVLECYHIAVALEPQVQPQPFALKSDDLDWQPTVSGHPEAQPSGAEAWIATPVEPDALKHRLWEMETCGVSTDVSMSVQNALSQPGSWIAFSTRGTDKVMIYSKPEQLALVYSNET